MPVDPAGARAHPDFGGEYAVYMMAPRRLWPKTALWRRPATKH